MKLKNLKTLSKQNKELFVDVYREVSKNSRFNESEQYIQHGKTTVKMHAITVTLFALNISEKFKIKVNKRELIRGALLHDYFLYDWHERKLRNLHGFRHPKRALREALKDFDLSDREIDIIEKHMFPLTYSFPKYKESLLVCISDKICAWGEIIEDRISYLNLSFK